VPGEKNVVSPPLVLPEKIYLPPLHIKLGLMKNFVKGMDMNETERNAWLSFKRICKDFLGNHKAANYQDAVQDLLTSYRAMGCNMSLKIHFLESHFNFFFPRKSRRSQ